MAQTKQAALHAANGESQSGKSEKGRDPRPQRILPTNRVATAKQFDIIRAFGAASGLEKRAVTNLEVSKIVDLHHATVGLVTPFLVDVGFLSKGNDGLVPADAVGELTRAYEWNPETAFQRVSPILRRAWFFTALEPRLRFKPLSHADAIQELSVVSGAGTNYRNQLETILEYLNSAGLVSLEGDQVRLTRQSQTQAVPQDEPCSAADPSTVNGAEAQPQPAYSAVATSFASQPAGVVQFNISVKVDMAELADWEPTRISAFFAGIAQVLAAKGNVEEKHSRA